MTTTPKTQSVDVFVCREMVYGTSNALSTATGNATAANRWADTGFAGTNIDGSSEDGTYFEDEYYIVPVSGTAGNIGVPRKVSSWITADDEFEVTAAWPSTPQSGDTAFLVQMMRATLNSDKITHGKTERPYQSSTFTQPSPVAGKPNGDIDITTEFIAAAVHHALLMSSAGSLLQEKDSTAIVSGGSASLIRITDTESSKAALNGLVAVNTTGSTWIPARITSIDASGVGYDELGLSPTLPTNPAAAQAVKFLKCYQSAETGHASCTVIVATNAEYKTYTGVRFNLDIPEMNPGGYPELHFVGMADNGTRSTGSIGFNPVYSSKKPPASFNGFARINGTDYEMLAASFDYANEIVEKPVFEGSTGRAEYLPTGRGGGEKASFRIYDDGDATTRFDLYKDNTEIELLVMHGSPANASGCVAFCLPTATIMDMSDGDEGGLKTLNCDVKAHDDQTTTDGISNRLVVGWTD